MEKENTLRAKEIRQTSAYRGLVSFRESLPAFCSVAAGKRSMWDPEVQATQSMSDTGWPDQELEKMLKGGLMSAWCCPAQ